MQSQYEIAGEWCKKAGEAVFTAVARDKDGNSVARVTFHSESSRAPEPDSPLTRIIEEGTQSVLNGFVEALDQQNT